MLKSPVRNLQGQKSSHVKSWCGSGQVIWPKYEYVVFSMFIQIFPYIILIFDFGYGLS
jgi:hypothetical protein